MQFNFLHPYSWYKFFDLNRDNESDAVVSVSRSFHNLNEQGKMMI